MTPYPPPPRAHAVAAERTLGRRPAACRKSAPTVGKALAAVFGAALASTPTLTHPADRPGAPLELCAPAADDTSPVAAPALSRNLPVLIAARPSPKP